MILRVLAACAVIPLAAAAASVCAACHSAETRSQPATAMANALQPASRSAVLAAHPVLRYRSGRFQYVIQRDGDRVTYSVSADKDSLSFEIAWAFGHGLTGQTFVYQSNGSLYEARVSYYTALNGLDWTTGDALPEAPTIAEAAGRRLDEAEVDRCFGCNSTRTADGVRPGFQCERCHEDAQRHADSMHVGSTPVLPRKLSALDGAHMADFCGGCHRTWSQVEVSGPWDVRNVRFQPYRLVGSACFSKASPIRCVACHDPHGGHRAANIDFYDKTCQTCHTTNGGAAPLCHVGTHGCVGCHMPKVELPDVHFRFTDHRIRVVHPGDPYPG